MSENIVVGIVLTADGRGLVGATRKSRDELDRLTGAAKKTGRGARRLERDTAKLERRMKATSAATGFLRREMVALVGAYGATRSVKAVVTAYASFEQGLLNVASVSGATAAELERLKEAALAAALATRFDTVAATEALYALASAGFTVEQQMAALRPVLDFAAAVQADLGQASELVAGALKTFSLEAAQAGRVADVFTASVGASRLNAGRLELAMRNAGPTAAAYQQSLEGTVAALGKLTDIFGTGMRAGSGLAAAFAELNDQGRKLGIAIKDDAGKFLPLVEIIRRMEKQGWDSTRAIQVFGREAGPALANLLNVGSNALEKMESRLQSSGQAAKTAGKQMSGLQGDLDRMSSAFGAFLVKLGEKSEGIASVIVRGITQGFLHASENINKMTALWREITGGGVPHVVVDMPEPLAPKPPKAPAATTDGGGRKETARFIEEQTDAIGAYTVALEREVFLLGLDSREREVMKAIMQAQNMAMAENNLLTVEQVKRIREAVEAKRGLAEAASKAAAAEKKHIDAIRGIEQRYAALPKTYEQATAAATAWRDETLAGLDATKAGYAEFAAQVDQVYNHMQAEAQEESLRQSREWSDGVIRGLGDVEDAAGDMASHMEEMVTRAFGGMEDALVQFVRTGKMDFASLADAIIEDLIRIQVRAMITEPLAGAMQGFFSGIFSSGGADASLAPQYQATGFAHSGGMVSAITDIRPVDPRVFGGAPRFHGGGLASGERPIIVREDEGIFTPRQMDNANRLIAAAMNRPASPRVIVNITDQRGSDAPDARVDQSLTPDGDVIIGLVIPAVEDALDRGMLDEPLGRNFNIGRYPAPGS